MTEVSKKVYLFANWKMYLNYSESLALAEELAEAGEHFDEHIKMAVFPSALALASVSDVLATSKISVGSQNVYWVDKGGYTGEVSANMVKEVGVSYVLVGHSERRHLFHETNHEVRQKMEAAIEAGLTPVLCVGETKAERDAAETKEVVEAQTLSALHELEWPSDLELIIAYEPVWAIGTGEPSTPVDAEINAKYIYNLIGQILPNVKPTVLYGGSVRPENVAVYVSEPHVSGVLVGASSAKRLSWLGIVESAAGKSA